MDNSKKEVMIQTKSIYKGKVIDVRVDDVKCPNNNISKREVVSHPGGVCILAIVDGNVLMEKQFRYPFDEEVYELPAGKLEHGEDSYGAGLRELEEETGYKASSMENYGVMYPTVGYSNEKIYLYKANGLELTQRNLDDDEVIDIIKMPLERVVSLIKDGTIKDAKTICLISKYLMNNK